MKIFIQAVEIFKYKY